MVCIMSPLRASRKTFLRGRCPLSRGSNAACTRVQTVTSPCKCGVEQHLSPMR